MSQRHCILNAGRLPPALLDRLRAEHELVEPSALAGNESRIEAAVTSAATGIDNATLDRLPNLKVISSFGVGLDRLDIDYARQRSLAVGYTPDVLNDCVADLAFGLVLDVARSLSAADRFVRRGEWTKGVYPLARKVSGAKLGIVGLGRIGRAIAERSTGFRMDVRYHTRRVVADAPWQHEPVLTDLARWADYLVIITAGGAGTRHLVNEAVLDALGPEGFIVNVARGTVIDEQALVRALQQRRIAGAGLDVFESEPHVPPELFTLDNVVLLPHIASATKETRQAMADRVYDNLDCFFREGRVISSALD